MGDWIREQMRSNEISPSLVFRDAMLEKKREWDAIHSENPVIFHKRIDDLKKTLKDNSQKFNDFIDSRGLTKEFIDFFNTDNLIKPKLRKKQKGFVKEIIEKDPRIKEQKVEVVQ